MPGQTTILRSALRKATWRLIPLIALGYGVAYMDRVNIGYAKLQMNADLHFTETIYGLGAGLFFLSYAVCEIPSNLLLYRLGARRWLSRIMVSWGVVAMAMVFVRTPFQFYLARFMLGIAEAGFFPGIIYYLFLWFPDEVRASAITRFYIAFPISTIVMGAIAGWLMGLGGVASLTGWQWLFLVEAIPAIILGVIFFLLLPDGPADAKWLTPQEREAITQALGQGEHAPSGSHSLLSALREPRVWLIGVFFMCIQTAGYAYNFFAPTLVQRRTGASVTVVGWVLACFGVLGTLAMLGAGWFSDRTGNRHTHVLPWCLLMMFGFVICGITISPWMALPALALVFAAYCAMQGPLWAIPPAFLSGRSAAAGVATINMLGILGGFFGPYWMGFARDLTGDYQRGLLTMALPLAIAAGILVWLRVLDRPAIHISPPTR
ncbi:MAG TPA: MFS transporter [Acidobacteriaceae bacterium]|nr:MFS transporter [Acidobacteriaceae bacterium]